ncbi:CRISPR-associated protein, Csm2 family [Methanocaldococcus villosus KIN24-T80]|uniref:CRISPR system Cms protein Csm2 n=1 Tax=Methanocaldococcus villosus KIN24-T80 TaxID=1069083 RepID=N6VPT7_9EURY|nr:type III-A CRISPR-associated protein Csm2 [Methanocaldococcus villosus]ENN95915.1 CRISPR-associated protein, Csm2 family [Methanocaldococcus villosus KIN24-T80]
MGYSRYQNLKGERGEGNRKKEEKEIVLNDKEIDIILNITSENANKMVEIAEKFANEILSIPNTKIREFYDYVLKIKENEDWYKKLVLLKPKMAYTYGKETNKGKKIALKKLHDTFSEIIDRIDNLNKFNNFKTFFEAVIAYHKLHGGKEN